MEKERIINEYTPLALAFIGDAHFNLTVKDHIVRSFETINKMQKESVRYVSAAAQAGYISYLLEKDLLSEEEQEIYKRGRNSKPHHKAKNADIITYKMATGFESLWGYWYLSENQQRMKQVWDIIRTIGE
ncbi:MAG: ribonuclease III [Erysipelotrichaceae bacterium]|nr:ribonuclease III [Erysipelotrichaceae bacterium]